MSGENPDYFSLVQDKLRKREFKNYINYVEKVCKLSLKMKILPHLNIGALSYEELKQLKAFTASMGLMLESTNPKLSEKGNVHEFSPGKIPSIRIKHIENAGKLKIPFTTGILIGIGEDIEDRIRDLILINNLNKKYNHIQEVIIQNFTEKENIPYKPRKRIKVNDLLKIIGIARIIFKNDISIQIPPNLTERYIEKFLDLGIDDLGGISPFSIDYINPEKDWPNIDYLRSQLEKAGYFLRERLPVYDKFLDKPDFIMKEVLDIIKEIYNSSKFI